MSIPPVFRALVDDAAVFPPGSAPLEDALSAHERYRRSPFAELVGPLVVGEDLLPRLVRLAQQDATPTAVAVVTTAAGAADAARLVLSSRALQLAALEVRLDPGAPAVDQVGALDAVRATATVYVEVPRPPADDATRWDALLDAVAAAGFRLKFRTGGVSADAFPSEHDVARWVVAARDRSTPFKCTAGLHGAVRHTGEVTGFEHHGYLNVLLAAALAADGAGVDEVAAVLAERDPVQVAAHVAQAPPEVLAGAREAFASYGSCSVLEPLHDLVALGLVPAETAAGAE